MLGFEAAKLQGCWDAKLQSCEAARLRCYHHGNAKYVSLGTPKVPMMSS
jgi:hypothetical protein